MSGKRGAAHTFQMIGSVQALEHLSELRSLYLDAFAEPPYDWGDEHAAFFLARFRAQSRQEGFAMVEARQRAELVGMAFGVTLKPTTPWWRNLLEPLPGKVTEERTGRTFAVMELFVGKAWRRQRIAETMHDLLLSSREEERATLAVLPEAMPAQRAYAKWGWCKLAQKRGPLPTSPPFDVMVKRLK
jgi:GNAT superfamily N-acetyltransferase